MLLLLLALVALLAFANGANDNCKGVATLVGYGAASPRTALIWAALSTAAGAVVSFWWAAGLIRAFGGAGLFAPGIVLTDHFCLAVLVGAFGWVMLATVTGLPVSTTHAITGALCGAGLVGAGA
ncbi:MAG: inorganic phosphate transporter, partial [Phycisphaerae bacterium]|nr:inorganic phosphate transporter [Phycisphaerae bacterium]